MKIVVNTRLLLKDRLEGIGRFSFETLKLITQSHKEHQFIFLFDRKYDEEFIFSDNIIPIVIGPQARHPLLFYLWFEFSVTNILSKLKPDLFLSPDGYLPLSSETPALSVIHDLSFEHYPQDVPFLVRKYYKYFFPKFAKKAQRIATVSKFSKQDIEKCYGIDSGKIDVIYNGVSQIFQPITEIDKETTRKKLSRGHEYFLFVGSLHPRKNLSRLLSAFDKFKNSFQCHTKLLIVGEKYWGTKEMQDVYTKMAYKNDIIFTGRMPEKELHYAIASALALTYIPYFEGFGLPIIEAMKCETPVITSNTTSMPEVGCDAVLYVDPFSVDSISNALLRIASDKKLRNLLIEKGKERAAHFTWDKTAEKLWESIEKTVNKF